MDSRIKELADLLTGYSINVQPGDNVLISYEGDMSKNLVRQLIKNVYARGGLPHVQIRDAQITREIMLGIAHPEGRKIGTSIIDVKGIRIGIISCTFNDAYKDLNILAEALEKVEELDKQKVDFKICYVSWKFNIYFGLALDERQRGIAKILANMGIDYIVGAGPLFPMKYEIIKGSWNHFTHVAYSLGNLLYCSNNYNRNTSAVINLKITKDNNGKISSSDSYLPCYTWKTLGHHRRRVQFLNNRTYTKT